MKRGWKLALALLAVLAALLAINTAVVGDETKAAEPTVEGGRIVALPGGDVQVAVSQSRSARPSAPPIVLVHCYACSLHWFDRLAPMLARRHRVIRIDLLGHGGSEKPASGYEISEQAGLVAAALDRLRVEGAVVVGHSLGFAVTVALAERASQLTDRVVNIGEGANEESCELPFVAELGYAPVLGEAIWRVAPDFVVEDAYADAFAPGYEMAAGFPNPDQPVADANAMTFTAYSETYDAANDFVQAGPLDERLTRAAVPLLSIFGAEDAVCDPATSQEAYGAVPGARTATIEGAGHSPNVEKPRETARLILEFAADAGDEALRPPRDVGRGNSRARGAPRRDGSR